MESSSTAHGWLTAALLSLLVAACGGGGTGGSGGTGGGGGDVLCGGNRPPCPDDQYCEVSDKASCTIDDVEGVCKPRPEVCEQDCPGVCGCDDMFYCNACIAQQAGVDISSGGPPCGEFNNACGFGYDDCDEGRYCDYPDEAVCGAGNAHGLCLPKPEACQEDCPGVCGCDGQFYCNTCIAAAAGVDVDPLASCSPPGSVCGGLGNPPCEEGTYCDWPDSEMCGAADGTGTCQPIPQGCPEDCPGVCGCDGQFYCNTCSAAQAGVDVMPGDTSCLPPGDICGGLTGAACAANQYCDYPDNAMCGAADQTGTCQPIPESCTKDCPGVCGCDGQFYCNACIASQYGVDVAAGDTSCFPPPGGDCGGLAGATCGPEEYCDWTDVAMCGFTDQLGTCLPRPEVCPQDCPGVCGCDGQFYCNACMAAQAGMDVHPNIDCSP